jgi:uncharacterized membrane protein YeaQ/YmgE (transglycosylase-associated protein family)
MKAVTAGGKLPPEFRFEIAIERRLIMDFLWFILIGLAAGWLAGQWVKGSGYGVLGDIGLGILGALLGGFLFSLLGISGGGGLIGSLLVATLGAILLLYLLRWYNRHHHA